MSFRQWSSLWKEVRKAMVLPVLFSLLFVAFWYSAGSFKDYFELNWLLNFKQKFDFKFVVYDTAYCWFALCAAVSVLFFVEDKILKILSVLFLMTFVILQFFVYTPWMQYWLPVYPYFAILTAYWMVKWKNLVFRFALFTGFCVVSIVHMVQFLQVHNKGVLLKSLVFLSQQVLRLSEPEDLIVGNNVTLGGLRYEAAGYYWFGRDYTAKLDYHYFHRRAWPDIENIIKVQKPKIITSDTILKYVREDWIFSSNAVQSVPLVSDKDFLNQYYNYYGYIYVRKY